MVTRLVRYTLLTGVFMLCTISLFAQSERKPEVFLGYSNLQAQGLPDKNNVTGIFGSDFLNNRTTLHGFDTQVSGFLTNNFGITGNFSFNENSRSNTTSFGNDTVKNDIFYFMGGPTLSIGQRSRFQPFVRFLAGGAYNRFNIEAERTGISGTLTNTFKTGTTDFAVAAGGGIDWRISDKVKIRALQFDYAPVFLSDQSFNTLTQAGAIEPFTLNGHRMDNFRFSFGIVF
jgi:opacity protein-like surface antigen